MAKEKEINTYDLPLSNDEREQIEQMQEKSEATLKATN